MRTTFQVRAHSAVQNTIPIPMASARDGEHATYEDALGEIEARLNNASLNPPETFPLWYTIEKRYS